MNYYITLWIFFLLARAFMIGYSLYKRERKAGLLQASPISIGLRGETQAKIGFKYIFNTAISMLFNIKFLLIETLKFIPIALITYFFA